MLKLCKQGSGTKYYFSRYYKTTIYTIDIRYIIGTIYIYVYVKTNNFVFVYDLKYDNTGGYFSYVDL